MTIDEARRNIGRQVTYQAPGAPAEHGVIDSVGRPFAYVTFEGAPHTKATYPADLELADEGK